MTPLRQRLARGDNPDRYANMLRRIARIQRIRTENILPPIPLRQFDWCAYRDGHEERGGYGYGPTEAAAIADLLVNEDWP